jgi:polyhydroxyalkanoate synthesis regulator phasin
MTQSGEKRSKREEGFMDGVFKGEKGMLEEIKKGLLSGLGAVLVTRKNAEEATQKLVEEAKLTKEEAQVVVDELLAVGTRRWSETEASLARAIRQGVDHLDIARKKELHELRSRVEELERRLEKLAEQISTEKEN